MPEKNLLASFSQLESAKNCQQALLREGFEIVQVDDIGQNANPAALPHAPLLEWGRSGYTTRELNDKWTSSSSWDQSHTGLIEGASWLLTAVVPAEDASRAAHIIKRFGGSL